MQQKSKTKRSLRRRVIMWLAVLMLIMAVAVSVISYRALESTYMRLYNQKAQEIVRTLADDIDGDRLKKYVDTGETDEYYENLKTELNKVKADFSGIQYLYLFYPESDHFIYIIDSIKQGDDPDTISSLGERFDYGETEYKYLVPDIKAGRASENLIKGQDVGFGKTISAWAPVFDSDGKVAGMVEADCILSDLNEVVRSYALRITEVLVICILGVLLLAIFILRKNVTNPVGRLADLVDSYSHKALEKQKFPYDDEMQWLADSFVDMTESIDEYTQQVERVTAEKERIGAELSIATQIQADMLPRIFPPFPDRKDIDIYALMDPAKEVGGDFYDFFLIDDDHLCMVMADVSGKGVPAALFMVIAKTLIKNHAQLGESPAEILSNVNTQLCEGNEAELFVTVWIAIVELSTGKGMAANAGHEHPVICHPDGKFELVQYRHSPAVATLEGIIFREHEFELKRGDRLFVYTDGVPEATDAESTLFGTDRMLDALNRNTSATTKEMIYNVRREIDAFVGDAPQFDDITMLSFIYNGSETDGEEEITVKARIENLDEVLGFIDAFLEKQDCPVKTQTQIDIAAEEIFVNIAHYAYGEGEGDATIRIRKEDNPLSVRISFIDSGIPFNPLEREDPDVTLSAEERQIGGLGIFMVKKSMDNVEYENTDGKNIFRIKKILN